jgi:hypothetical protein
MKDHTHGSIRSKEFAKKFFSMSFFPHAYIQIVFQFVGQKLYGAKLLIKVVFVQRLDADASLHISSVYNCKWNSRISR